MAAWLAYLKSALLLPRDEQEDPSPEDLGFGFDDVEGDLQVMFVENELKRQRACTNPPSLTIRTDEGNEWSLGDGGAPVTGSRAAVLTWLARQDPTGVRADALPDLTRGL